MTTVERLRALHVEVRGSTMEPDPADPTRMRRTAYCRWCADSRHRDDPRWPCETAALLDVAEAVQRMLGSGVTGDHDEDPTDFWFSLNDAIAALDRLDGAS